MKDKVLLILFKYRMSARTLHSWADRNLWDDFFPDRMTELSQFVAEFMAAGYIEIVEYQDDMFGGKNVKWSGYKVTLLGERHLKEQKLL